MRKFVLKFVIVIGFFGFAQTDLSGTISQDKTLTLSESPYVLSDHLIVNSGITLSIEPGVTINATGTQQIVVQGGAIVAEATEANPILLNGVSGASIAIKQTNLSLSSFKHVTFNGFHLLVAAGETDNEQNKCFGTLALHNLKLTNNNISDSSRSGNTTIDIQNSTLENVTVARSHQNNFIVIEQSVIKNSTVNVSDFRFNNNSFYNTEFKSEGAYDFKDAVDDKITFTGNSFFESRVYIFYNYDEMIFEKSKFINTYLYSNGFYRDQPYNTFKITNSIVIQDKSPENFEFPSSFILRSGRRSRFTLENVLIVSNDKNIFQIENGYRTNVTIVNSTIESKNLPQSDSYFFMSHPSEDQAWTSYINNSNLYLKETPTNRFLIYNNMKSGFDAKSNYWGSIQAEDLPRLVYDFNDNPTASLGAVDFSNDLSEPNINAPISTPKGFIKQIDGDDLILKWVANSESDVAGYKIHYGTHTDYVFEQIIDVGNATSYTLTGGASFENVNITAYDTSAHGTDDMLEGHESWYTEAKDIPTLSFEKGLSSASEGNDALLKLQLNYASPEAVVVNLSYSGTATAGTDYNAPETITIPVGQTEATLTLALINDDVIEMLEDIQVTITSANGVTLNESNTHTVSVLSTDYPTFDVSLDKTEIDEGSSVEITLALSEAHSVDSSFKIKNTSLTATEYEYTLDIGSLTTFTKTWADDVNDSQYQDRINQYVSLTRGAERGLYNISEGEFYQNSFTNWETSPLGVFFALGEYSEGIENLDFKGALHRSYENHPKDHLRENYVMKVVSKIEIVAGEKIYSYDYYNLKFTTWDEGSNRPGWRETDTSVTYQRSKYPLNADDSGYKYFEIPAGESEIKLNVKSNQDTEIEGIENFAFSIESVSNVQTAQKDVSFTVNDQAEISIALSSEEVNEGESVTVTASVAAARGFDTELSFDISGDNVTSTDYRVSLAENLAIELLAGFGGQGNKLNQLNYPLAYAIDSADNIYISDQNNCRILKLTPSNESATLLKSETCAYGMQIKDDYLYVLESDVVWKKYIGSNTTIDKREITIAGGNGQGSDLHQLNSNNEWANLYVDTNENVYILDRNNHRIVKWVPDATDGILIAGSEVNGSYGNKLNELHNPISMHVTENGIVYVSDHQNHRVLKFTEGQKEGELVLGITGERSNSLSHLNYPFKIFVDGNENIYVADEHNHRILKKSAGEISVVAGGNGDGNNLNATSFVREFIIDRNDNIYVMDRGNNRISLWPKGSKKGIDLTSNIVTLGIESIEGLKFDTTGNVLYLDRTNHKLWRINNTPKITIPAGELSSNFTINVLQDGVYENQETLTLEASSIRDSQIDGLQLTINSLDELPILTMELSAESIDENQENDVVVYFSIDKPSVLDTSFEVVFSGTASLDTEYTTSATSVLIPAGETTAKINISTTGLDDAEIEEIKTIIITPSNVTNATVTDNDSITLNLLSDDYPTLTITPENTEYKEGNIEAFTISLSQAHSKNTEIEIAFGGSTDANDYVFSKELDKDYDKVSFTKTWAENAFDSKHQDYINEFVSLTRGSTQGLFNVSSSIDSLQQTSGGGHGSKSPLGVQFALGTYASGINTLEFKEGIDRSYGNHPLDNIGSTYVMKVVSSVSNVNNENVYEYDYYEIVFSEWDQGQNRDGWEITDTSLTYTRSKYPLNGNVKRLRVPAGETEASYTLEFVDDLYFEGVETLIKSYQFTNTSSENTTISLTVDDEVGIGVSITSKEVVEGESTEITASITEARTLPTVLNFNLSGTANADDITAALTLPKNGISTLFGVTGGNRGNEIKDMMLHKNQVYFTTRSGLYNINPDGSYSKILSPIDYGSFEGFTLDADDNVYIISDNKVYMYTKNSNYTEYERVAGTNLGSGLNQLFDPQTLILDNDNNLIIVDSNNHRILKWTPGETEGSLAFGDPNGGYASGTSGLNHPVDIAFDGMYYYVLDSNNRKRIVVLNKDFEYVSSTINFNNSTAPEQYYIESLFIRNNKVYVPLGLKDWNTTFNDMQGEIAVFNTFTENNPMVLESFIEFKYKDDSNQTIIPANNRAHFIIDANGNYYLQGDGNKVYFKQNAPRIVIPAGKLSSSVEILVKDDSSFEGDEELIFEPYSPNSAIDENLTLAIIDNDNPPSIQVSFSAPFIDENQDEAVVVTFAPSVQAGLEISFDLEISGTATIESEYILSATSITIAPNATASITVSTSGLDDDEIEIAETIVFNLTNIVNASFENPATLELHSDDFPEANIVIEDTEFAEHEAIKLKATLTEPHSKDTKIKYDVKQNSSIAKQYLDYYFTNQAGNINFIKPSWADDKDPEYQDRISETVWLTQGDRYGIYNAYDQVSNQRQATSNTLWALGSISDIENLSFDPISEWGQKFNNEGWLGKEMVLYLPDTKEYYRFVMTSWERQGGYSYIRSKSPIKTQLEFVIESGETEGYATISGVEDELMDEGTEQFTVSYNSVENGKISITEDITLSILDNTTTMTLREDVFVGVQNGDFSWGDFDSDGDKDLALIGDAGETLISKVYENKRDDNGNVIFEEIDVQFTGVGFGAVEWVDLNQDGKVDLFISGVDENVQVRSLVYINNSSAGNPSFELVDTYNFPELVETSLDFGDLDNDGDVDYAITGYDSNQELKAYYGYQNIETSNFEIKNANFEPFVNGELRIVDIDADGDNDVVYTGGNDATGERGGIKTNSYVPRQNNTNNYWDNWWQNEQLRAKYSTIEFFKPQDSNAIGYMVMGEGKSFAINAPLEVPQLKNGDIAAGDFNNNGVDDFLFTGETANGEGYTKLFEGKTKPVLNDKTGAYEKYTESIFTFDPLINSAAEWVDYDNDGDLDLFIIGLKIGEGEKTYLYETEVNNKKNTKPETITGLKSELVGNGVVKLSWSKPSDDFTNSLGYNVRLGKSSGGTELSYTISNLETGDLLISKSPNNYNLFYQTQLEPGTYYWSVQAVDQGLKAGPYSVEQEFTLTYDWKILNQGGLFDKSISSGNTPMLKVVDIDSDEDLDVILRKDNTVEFYSYSNGALEKTELNNFNNDMYNVEEIQFADFMNQAENSLFISSNNRLRGLSLGQTPNYNEFKGWEYNEKVNDWEEAIITEFPGQMRVITFQDGTKRVECWTNDCSVIPEKSTSIGVQNRIDIASLQLFEEKYGIADFNNDGINDIFVIGVDSDIPVFMDVKFYMFSFDKFTNTFEKIDLTDQISEIGRIKGPSFDFGDYDNDQDLDIIISGDKIVGTSTTKIFRNITNPGDKKITLEATDEVITGVSNGSTDFIDYDSDGDLDILLSGTDDTGVDVFELLENDQSGFWPLVETNLKPMKNTNVDLGDFNGDGYIDMLISGETAEGKVTKLMEYTPSAGFIESDFDVSDIVDARVEFGDLDGDEDLDFVIAGKSKSNESQNIFRTYLNYRNESYLVTNPPTFLDIDFMAQHIDNKTQVIMKDNIEVAAILLQFEKEVNVDLVATITELLALSNNGNPLTVVTNKNNVILYGDVTKAFSRQEFTTVLVHKPENLNGETGNSLERILSVAALKNGKLKSITAESKIYDPNTDDLSQFKSTVPKPSSLSMQRMEQSLERKVLTQVNTTQQNEDEKTTNIKPDMPYLLNATVVDGELDKSLGKLFVELSWKSAVDDNTDLEGLSYAIKMGTSPGAEDIISSNASVNGVRNTAGKGNAEHNTKWKIALEPGTYYWSVQSIDNAQTGSEFSFEDVFTVSDENLLYDLGDSNGDDKVNIADIINVVDFMLGVSLPRFIDYASDVNNDNNINVLDLMSIVDIILNPTTVINSLSVSTFNAEQTQKAKIKTLSDMKYRSSEPVGDVFVYWENGALFMESDHNIGGIQLSISNDIEVQFTDAVAHLNKTKIQRENEFEMVFYSINASALEDNFEFLTYYGEVAKFDLNTLVVSTPSGQKLNVKLKTLSSDEIASENCFNVVGTYPNPITEDNVTLEYYTPEILSNQYITVFDLLGRELQRFSIANNKIGLQQIALNLKGLPLGVLFIEFSAEKPDNSKIKHTSKVLKQ